MTERSYRFGDPAKILEMEQNRTCQGCISLLSLWGMRVCKRTNEHAKRRCKHYDNPTEKGTA